MSASSADASGWSGMSCAVRIHEDRRRQVRHPRTGVSVREIVAVDSPDDTSHRRALRGLCSDLNQLGVTFPDTEVHVIYHVGVHHSEAAA